MVQPIPYTINANGKLIDLSTPQVMGILNITPDSFYAGSRTTEASAIAQRTTQIMSEGADMIDIGAYSSRPGADDVSAEEEMKRLRKGLDVVRQLYPEAVVSVDTFRADVARMCVEEYGVQIINDISGGQMDATMFKTVARLGVAYVLMHMKGTPQTMQNAPTYENLIREVMLYFAEKVQALRDLGAKDIILDPGFGFAKTLDHNYLLMQHLEDFRLLELPVLVGISRKSMIYRLLGTDAEQALNGTSVLNTVALMKGANILRVHDVKECAEAVRIVETMRKQTL